MTVPSLPVSLLAASLACLPALLAAQDRLQGHEPPPPGADSVTIVPGARYRAGGFHRFLFGGNHRRAWDTPVRVAVLDLATFGGGLTPTEVGGGMQTSSLHFENAEGQEFVFRSVDKDLTTIVPADLRGSLVHRLFQDEVSSMYPLGGLVVGELLDATGIPHVNPRLRVMPDDPRLGEFRERFAGMLGLIEQRPDEGPDDTPGFRGARKIVGTEELFERLNEDPEHQVDARTYLMARLFDMWINDWDRHADQWRWIRRPAGDHLRWVPIPRDRDQAFVHFDGFLISVGRFVVPKLIAFDSTYPSLKGLTLNSVMLDRRLLSGLERPVFDSVARALQARLDDRVISRAVAQLPPSYSVADTARLAGKLRARRTGLPDIAAKFYRSLAGVVDIHATDAAERARVEYAGDGSVTLSLADARDSSGVGRWFHRTFHPEETSQLRVYLHGGDDSATIAGARHSPIVVRVIGGNGDNHLVDSRPEGYIRLYDEGPTRGIEYGPPDSLDRRPLVPGRDSLVPPPPDHGGYVGPLVNLAFEDDLGVVYTLGARYQKGGFRKRPYSSDWELRYQHAAGYDASGVNLEGDVRQESSGWHLRMEGAWSELGVLRFYGFGNATAGGDGPEWRVDRGEYRLHMALAYNPKPWTEFSVGPVVRYGTVSDDAGRLAMLGAAGLGSVGQAGVELRARRDTRESPHYAASGTVLAFTGEYYPAVWDLDAAYGALTAEARAYHALPVPMAPVIALRAGGRRVWGEFPFYDAAYLGGVGNLRSYAQDRFAGEGSLYGNAELRVPVGRVPLYIFPVRLMLFGFGDVGRVFADGERSDTWHTAFGGGVSLGFINPQNNLTISLANNEERTALYVSFGFDY